MGYKCKKCGHEKFSGHQRIYTDIVVDGENNFIENLSKDGKINIYETKRPYGPYTCMKCDEVVPDDNLIENWQS